MKPIHFLTSLLALFTLGTAQAHRVWVLHSSTVLSGEESWVTFDACATNNIFFANHRPMNPESLQAVGPDGNTLELHNALAGKLRTTFDLNLTQEGTYRIGSVRSGLTAFWREGEERKRWSGTREDLVRQGIHQKQDVRLSDGSSSVITYVTLGKPSREILKPSQKGLEISFPETHPNDLVAGEALKVVFLLNGKPAKGLEFVVIKDGDRHRNDPEEKKFTTNDQGEAEIVFPEASFYWLEAELASEGAPIEGIEVNQRHSLALTLEVFPE